MNLQYLIHRIPITVVIKTLARMRKTPPKTEKATTVIKFEKRNMHCLNYFFVDIKYWTEGGYVARNK